MNIQAGKSTTHATSPETPRLGFLGVGWIGLNRLQSVHAAGCGEIVAIADPSDQMRGEVHKLLAGVREADGLESLLDEGLDGLVIATPSALHADQAVRALERGVSVFCQKPLGRNADEVRRVVETARRMDCLLAVDLSYRHTQGMRQLRDLVRSGEAGRIFAAEITFHNAYGPDKPWFYDRSASGGGCLMDLGVHLVDLLLWTLDWPDVEVMSSSLFREGNRFEAVDDSVEDHAFAALELADGTVANLACSWHLHAGQDADISFVIYGSRCSLAFRNVDGSFFDFRLERQQGTNRQILCEPPDMWGGRAICDWVGKLQSGEGFDPEIGNNASVAHVLDRIYDREPRDLPRGRGPGLRSHGSCVGGDTRFKQRD